MDGWDEELWGRSLNYVVMKWGECSYPIYSLHRKIKPFIRWIFLFAWIPCSFFVKMQMQRVMLSIYCRATTKQDIHVAAKQEPQSSCSSVQHSFIYYPRVVTTEPWQCNRWRRRWQQIGQQRKDGTTYLFKFALNSIHVISSTTRECCCQSFNVKEKINYDDF